MVDISRREITTTTTTSNETRKKENYERERKLRTDIALLLPLYLFLLLLLLLSSFLTFLFSVCSTLSLTLAHFVTQTQSTHRVCTQQNSIPKKKAAFLFSCCLSFNFWHTLTCPSYADFSALFTINICSIHDQRDFRAQKPQCLNCGLAISMPYHFY